MDIDEYTRLVDTELKMQNNASELGHPVLTDYTDLHEKVGRLVGGGARMVGNLKAMMRELIIRHIADDSVLQPYYWIVSTIYEAVRNNKPEILDQDWPSAIRLIQTNPNLCYASTQAPENVEQISKGPFELGRAIRTFRTYGFDVEINQGAVVIPEGTSQRLADEFDSMTKAIGGVALLDMAFSQISSTIKLNEITEHFDFVRKVSTSRSSQIGAQTPWGFILQLSMKHISVEVKYPSSQMMQRLVAVATAAAAILDVQPYNPFEQHFVDHNSLIEYLQKTVVYDTLFTVPQMRGSHAQRIYHGVFTLDQVNQFSAHGVNLKTALILADEILRRAEKQKMVVIEASSIASAIGYCVTKTTRWINQIFAHPAIGPNQSLRFPPLANQLDSSFRPLLMLHDGRYLLMPRSIIAPGLLESLLMLARDADSNFTTALGTNVEQFLRREFNSKGIKYKAGKYDLRRSNTHEIRQQSGDCDLVIESSNRVALLECKCKPLTRLARSGHPINLLVDMAKSLVHSQAQAMRHQKLMTECSTFPLDDAILGKQTICLNGRAVERISVSLHDYNSLQDNHFLPQFLTICCNATFNSSDAAAQLTLDEIDKKELGGLKEMAKDLGELSGNRPFWSSAFMSVPQILLILEHADDNEAFLKEFRRTRTITFATRNFYYEYALMIKMASSQGK